MAATGPKPGNTIGSVSYSQTVNMPEGVTDQENLVNIIKQETLNLIVDHYEDD